MKTFTVSQNLKKKTFFMAPLSSNSLLHFFGSFSEHNDIDKGENNLDQVIEALQMELFADIRNSNPERKVCRVIYFIYLYILYVPFSKMMHKMRKKKIVFHD